MSEKRKTKKEEERIKKLKLSTASAKKLRAVQTAALLERSIAEGEPLEARTLQAVAGKIDADDPYLELALNGRNLGSRRIAEKLDEVLEARKVVSFKGEAKLTDAPDYDIQMKGLNLLADIRGDKKLTVKHQHERERDPAKIIDALGLDDE